MVALYVSAQKMVNSTDEMSSMAERMVLQMQRVVMLLKVVTKEALIVWARCYHSACYSAENWASKTASCSARNWACLQRKPSECQIRSRLSSIVEREVPSIRCRNQLHSRGCEPTSNHRPLSFAYGLWHSDTRCFLSSHPVQYMRHRRFLPTSCCKPSFCSLDRL